MGYDWKGWSVLFYLFSALFAAVNTMNATDYGLTPVTLKWLILLFGIGMAFTAKMGASWATKTGSENTVNTASLMKLLIPFAAACTVLTACTPPSTVTTEPGKRAWQALEVLKRVEEVQLAAIDAEKSAAITARNAKIVIDFTVVAAKTCKVYSIGWEKALATAYRETKAKLPPEVIDKSPVSYLLGIIEGVIMSLNGGVL